MAWAITFAIAAAVALAVYAAARWHDTDRPVSHRNDARLAAGAVFVLFAALGTLNILAWL